MNSAPPTNDRLAELDAWWEGVEDDGGAVTTVLRFVESGEGYQLDFLTTGDAGERAEWRLEVEDCLDMAWFHTYGEPKAFQDHVLLALYQDQRAVLSFSKPFSNPVQAWGAVAQSHRGIAGDWMPLGRFVREDMFRQTFGILAAGPRRLIEAYDEALRCVGEELGMMVSPNRPRYEASLVTFGSSYFIAKGFRLVRMDEPV